MYFWIGFEGLNLMEQNYKKYIRRCIDLALNGKGNTKTNPMVGCVIVHNDEIIGEGYHESYGGPHAEVNAIKQAYFNLTNDKSILTIEDSKDIHEYLYKNHNNIFSDKNIYVTLEPCNHFGKTPPCSKLIKELDFKKVFEYIEPSDINLEVYSHRLYELLLRAATECETNFTSILKDNDYIHLQEKKSHILLLFE